MSTLAASPVSTSSAVHSTEMTALTRASYVLLASGLLFAVEAVFAPELLRMFYDLVASGGTTTVMSPAARLGAALFGALTFGWGVTLRQIGGGDSVIKAARTGIIAWCVVDSAASMALGYAWNTVSNLGFVLVLLLLLRVPCRA